MKLLKTLCFCLTIGSIANADIIPVPGTQSVGDVFRNSDIVCNCVVQSVSVTREEMVQTGKGHLTRQHKTALVRVEDRYKGDQAAGSLLKVDFETEVPTMRALPSLSESEEAVLFLRKSGGSYVFADTFLGENRFDRVPQVNGEEGILKLQSALNSIIRAGNHSSMMRAMTLIQGMDRLNPDTIGEMDLLSHSSDPGVALSALVILVKADPVEGTDRLSSFLDSYGGDDHAQAFLTLFAKLTEIHDPRALPGLESLTSSRFPTIRLGSVVALRGMKVPQAAATLAQRLDDTDRDIQFQAVLALAEIYHKTGEYAPTTPLFDSNPQRYTDLWKTWLQESGTNATVPPPQ